ncbi:oxygen-independent coproporphyrinogen III oxidase [Rhodoblastus sp. 17X3]|uniref:oxygen-independent coproporphyrinogen III oxidase n=1 Tax=Rhodoblastus sp. 17X3 TaxID=3047026 RepID=UPI0024B72BA9|nr:oxygen-independent coproporphyrinogen III oxidase [Rhodoblastus sp. 17X3]MDI9847401.1 oxygen-independent coproporphyrinogen III oxidase [Rhodoblastus sp. 17X3]
MREGLDLKTGLSEHYREERLPRYTSYPTAPNFTGAVTTALHGDWLSSIEKTATASLYLHVPFCRSMCWYCGCHTTIAQRDAPIADYLAVLRREIELVTTRISPRLDVRHVHFGGGTPTIMAPEEFSGLIDLLREKFLVDASAEIAVEIDPRRLTSAMTAALGRAGVNRASLGVQSFDPIVQKAINRLQSIEQTAMATAGLRAAGVGGVNFDLIYGLPHQTIRSCVETVARCVDLRPDRFAVFGYAHVPTFKKHQRKIDEAALPDTAERLEQAEAIAQALVAAGYERIGLDHFALPGDSLARAQSAGLLHRNFQGYTTDPADVLIGFGASAISRFPQGYVQNEIVLGRHAERVLGGELPGAKGYQLTADDRLRADLIERLMCDFEVDLARVGALHQRSPEPIKKSAPRLQALVADGIVHIDGDLVRIAENSRFLVRTVASAFDAYLSANARTGSQAV